MPSCEAAGLWKGQTPGTMGEVIRLMPIPAGGSKNLTGGSAPPNSSL